MKMNIILSGNHYMMVVNKIHKEYFTCNVLSCNGNTKVRACIYPNGKADLYGFNGVPTLPFLYLVSQYLQ